MPQSGFTPIITYNTATASAAPSAGNLTQGELAVNVTDKKIYTKNSGGSVVQVGSGPDATETLTNKTLTSPDINGGTIDGAVIGSTTPAAGSFTTVSASSYTASSGYYINASTVLTPGATTQGTQFVTSSVLQWACGSGGYSWNNNANSASLMSMTNAGAVTIPGSVTISGGLTSTAGFITATTPGSGVSGLQINSTNADAANRNWVLVTNKDAFGDFHIAQSNAQNGDPFNAGTSRLKISNAGAVTIPGGITQESVIAPTLLNSWVNYGAGYSSAGYWIDTLGVVHLQGMMKDGTIGLNAFVLPVGYRPPEQLRIAVVTNSLFGWVVIGADGTVNPYYGNNSFFCLDGITFRV